MKKLTLFAIFFVTCIAHVLRADTVLIDNFSGSAINNALWRAYAPLGDSQMTEAGGNAVFTQRGILVTQADMPDAIEITGRFAFGAGTYDQFQINLRSDGIIDTPYYNFHNNIYVGFNRRGGDDGNQTGQHNVAIAAGLSTAGVLRDFTFATDVFYDFRIVDTGTKISLYLSDLTNPFLSVDTTERTGNLIGLENRGYVPWFPTTGNEVRLDYIRVRGVPETAPTLALLGVSFLGLAALGRRFVG